MREIVDNSGNIFEDQGNMEHDFWERENLVKVNFGEHLNLFLRNKSTNVNFYREQGNMHPPPLPWEAFVSWWYYNMVIDLIGQLRRDVIGRLSEEEYTYQTHTQKNYREKWLKYGNS